MRIPPFIAQWGLDADADERAIKRAYATRLKKIDQEADPAGFQQLRETYEAALRWVKAKEAAAPVAVPIDATPVGVPPGESPTADAVATDAPPAQQAESPPSPEQLASAVFEDFMAGLPTHVRKLNDAVAALHRHLDDPRLVNLEARNVFEWLIGRQLAEGWRPGHEVLLVAAVDCFQWEADRSRLGHFGRVGAMLDAALNERAVFHHQPEAIQVQYRLAIHQLRQDGHPGKAFLLKHMAPLETLGNRLPNWLWIITKVENIKAWREWTNALPEASKNATPKTGASYQAPAKKSGVHWWAVFAVIMLIGKLISFSSPSSSSSSPNYATQSLSSALSKAASSNSPDPSPADPAPVTLNKDAYGLPIAVPSLDQPQAQANGNTLDDVGLSRSGSHLYKGLPDTAVYPGNKPSRQAEPHDTPPPDRVPTSPSRMDKVVHDFDPGQNVFSTPTEVPHAAPPAQPITPPSTDGGP